MLSAAGLIGGLGLLIFLTVRGLNILIAAPFCALIVATTSGIAWLPPLASDGAADFATSYMAGFTSFFANWFLMFLLGAIFGELMSRSGASEAVARAVINRFGADHALLAVVAACAFLTYGGVSVFIVAFSVYPMALSIFRQAGLPRRFIPGAIAFGSVTFTMTSAGSPEIQNLIPIQYLGTRATAAWEVSLVIALLMAVSGHFWLRHMVAKAVASGEAFEARSDDADHDAERRLPSPLLSLLPLLIVLGSFIITQYPAAMPGIGDSLPANGFGKWGLVIALAAGVAAAAFLLRDRPSEFSPALSVGAMGAVIATVNTCAVVGFGSVAKLTPAFGETLVLLQSLPADPLIGAAIAVTVIAGLTGSASGGQSIALPLIAPGYLEAGVNPNEFHRVVAIASGALDSLPHNGYVVTTIRAICGETHASAYGPVAALTVVMPVAGLLIALALFIVF